MTEFLQILNHPFVEILGWSLVHFLWQGILLATFAAAVLTFLKDASASLRYIVACLALILMAAAPTVTAWHLISNTSDLNSSQVAAAEMEVGDSSEALSGSLVTNGPLPGAIPDPIENAGPTPTFSSSATGSGSEPEVATPGSWLTIFVTCWLSGVTALSLRLILTLVRVSQLRSRDTSLPAEALVQRVEALARRLGVSRPVRLAQSALVDVPTVIGVLRPLILLPATALTGLSVEQLDAILAHEIAHIRRHDCFINLILTVIETLLFYHPAVWWLSGRIRQERENCCDDIASAVCGNPIRYAEALIRMEELRTPAGGLAMAATGGSLALRIRRLLGQPARESSRQNWWIGGFVSLLIVAALVSTVVSQSSETQAEEMKDVPLVVVVAGIDDRSTISNAEDASPPSPAQLADAMEASMKNYVTIDLSANFLKGQSSEIELSDSNEGSLEFEASVRYQTDGKRFIAERNATDDSNGGTWVEGFDGKTHYHTDSGLLILGEESGPGQALSATSQLFSLNGWPTETLRFLRDENAGIVEETTIEGAMCHVIEVPFERGDRSWTYRIAVAPERSFLPLVIARSEKGETTARRTLSQLEQTAGKWFARQISTTRYSDGKVSQHQQIRVTRFSTRPGISDDTFAPPIAPGTNVLDRRVGYGWHEGPWWGELKPWLQEQYGWPRPDLFELHSVQHVGPLSRLEGKPAPTIEPAEWLTPNPGGWDRSERKLTLLYFYGGRLISPTPKWAGAINELYRRYRKFGFEVIGLAAATETPELPRQAAEELNLDFSVGIDRKSDTGYGKTFLAYGLASYHGLFFVDHEGLVQTVSQGNPSKVIVNGKEFTISHMEAKVVDLLKKAGVENVEPQVLPSDIFDIKTHNEVLARWRSLRAAAPRDASIVGRITFNGAPVAGASIKLQPTMTIMSSTTGHGFMLFPDRAGTITVPTSSDGTFEIRDLAKGEYKFTCSASGMKNQDRTILIGNDLPTVNVDVGLTKN
ncbi:MAG: carboxypeptidase regulatory-like domain-containing protein [Planctomycetota bacterium]|nr:carboxypeptidase regulatory-like domain-containing protein [Planctomycetota bacterium]